VRFKYRYSEKWYRRHVDALCKYCWKDLHFAKKLTDIQIEEVKQVTQVLDQEEEIAASEFAKFEEKLRQQKGVDANPSTVGKGSLDTVPG
jgi:hypothetical protein